MIAIADVLARHAVARPRGLGWAIKDLEIEDRETELTRASRLSEKNKERVVEAMTQWFGIDQEVANESYDQMVLAYPINGATSPEVLKKDLDIAQQLGAIQADVPLSRVADFRLLREVQKDLGLQN